jgi:hypothetical protein
VAAARRPRISTRVAATQTGGSDDVHRELDSQLYITLWRAAESQLEILFSTIGLVPIDRRAALLAAVENEFEHRAGALRPDPGSD